jgi:hypothetical protein
MAPTKGAFEVSRSRRKYARRVAKLPVTAQKIIQVNTPQKIYGNSTLYPARVPVMEKT